jgi:MFS transporter, ACS family, glucarate transporter
MEFASRPTKQPLIPIRYLLVFWLFVLSAVAYLDRTNISIAGVQIGGEFGVDNAHLGWVFSAFLIGYACFQIPAGVLAKRLGPRRLLAISVAWWSVFTILTALVPPGVQGAVLILVLVRFALGAGEAAMYPATSQFVERWFPIQERGKANGIIFGGVGIGSGLTPPLVTAIILRYGWRASFWFSALVGAVVGIVWYIAARDDPREHAMVGEGETALIEKGRRLSKVLAANLGAKQPVGDAIPWLRIFASKAVLGVSVSYFAFGYVAWIFFAWFYIYLAQVRGLNLKTSAMYSMLPFIAMTVGCLLGGATSDWITKRYGLRLGRCLLPGLALGLTAILIVVGSRAHDASTAALTLACGAGVLYIAQSAFWAVTADIAGEHVGVVSGIMNMGGQIGGACTASLTPLIAAHHGWNASFATAAAIATVGAMAWITIDPTQDILGGGLPDSDWPSSPLERGELRPERS